MSGKRVLIVEDHPDTLTMLGRVMRGWGCDVRSANCVAAAAAFEAEPIDVLLCDLTLPDGTGWDLVRRFKQRRPALRAVALSGHAYPADVSRSLEAGFDVHLAKPVPLQTLREAVAGCGPADGAN